MNNLFFFLLASIRDGCECCDLSGTGKRSYLVNLADTEFLDNHSDIESISIMSMKYENLRNSTRFTTFCDNSIYNWVGFGRFG